MNTCMKCAHKNVCEWCIDDSEYEFPTCSDFLEERPHGKWIKDEDTGLVGCSNCHIVWLRGFTKFCPNCGAEMRGDEA